MRQASSDDDAFRSLCGLIRMSLSGAPLPEMADPSALVPLARRHRLLDFLNQVPNATPDIKAAFRSQALRGLQQAAALTTILNAAQQRGLPVLVLKGVALSLLLHGTPSQRAAGDIDLLVPSDRFRMAADLLLDLGYVVDADGPPLDVADAGARHIRDLTFIGHGQRIELHRRLYELSTRLPDDFETFWSQRSELALGPVTVATLGPAHLALYLLVHGHGHDWERLRWLVDLALLLRQPGALAMLREQARQFRVERACTQALALIAHLFGPQPGMPAPQKVPARPLQMMTVYGVPATAPANSWVWFRELLEYKWRYYRLHDGLADFLPAAWQDMMVSSTDMTLVRFPSGLRWLYPVLWPIGFVWRNVRLFAGNSRQ